MGKDGNIIIGEFKKAKANGKGIIYYNSGENKGDKYIGDIIEWK